MRQNPKERRRYKRIFFSEKEGVQAHFSFLGNSDLIIPVKVLDLSENGLGMSLLRDNPIGLRSGDILLLRKITGHDGLRIIRDTKVQIRWMLNHRFLDNIGFGCEFMDLPSDARKQLQDILETARATGENGSGNFAPQKGLSFFRRGEGLAKRFSVTTLRRLCLNTELRIKAE